MTRPPRWQRISLVPGWCSWGLDLTTGSMWHKVDLSIPHASTADMINGSSDVNRAMLMHWQTCS